MEIDKKTKKDNNNINPYVNKNEFIPMIQEENKRPKRNILRNKRFLKEENFLYDDNKANKKQKNITKRDTNLPIKILIEDKIKLNKKTKRNKSNLAKEQNTNKFNLDLNEDKKTFKKKKLRNFQENLNFEKNSYISRNTLNGLKEISKNVLNIVKNHKSTNYKEISDLIINEINSELRGTKDEKNIRRRIYDSLNVLKAMGILKENSLKKIMLDENSKNRFLFDLLEDKSTNKRELNLNSDSNDYNQEIKEDNSKIIYLLIKL